VLGITGLPLHILVFVGKTNTENSEEISICGLHIHMRFNECLPLLDHTPEFVCGKIHAMEVCEDVVSLNVFCDETEFAERTFSIVVVLKISQGNFEDTMFQTLRGNFRTRCPVNEGLANLPQAEHRRRLHIVPFFPCEGIDSKHTDAKTLDDKINFFQKYDLHTKIEGSLERE